MIGVGEGGACLPACCLLVEWLRDPRQVDSSSSFAHVSSSSPGLAVRGGSNSEAY